jgi:hypothetical protein
VAYLIVGRVDCKGIAAANGRLPGLFEHVRRHKCVKSEAKPSARPQCALQQWAGGYHLYNPPQTRSRPPPQTPYYFIHKLYVFWGGVRRPKCKTHESDPGPPATTLIPNVPQQLLYPSIWQWRLYSQWMWHLRSGKGSEGHKCARVDRPVGQAGRDDLCRCCLGAASVSSPPLPKNLYSKRSPLAACLRWRWRKRCPRVPPQHWPPPMLLQSPSGVGLRAEHPSKEVIYLSAPPSPHSISVQRHRPIKAAPH